MRRSPGAYTLVEVIVGLALVSVILGVVYGVFHAFFQAGSRSNLTGLTKRSVIQKDAKAGVRRLTYRLREGTQILSPVAGTSAEEVVFRDITNADIRIRRIPAENKVVSERNENGTWTRETQPLTVTSGAAAIPVGFPVSVQNCSLIRFTTISGGSVVVEAVLETEGSTGSLLTLVKLRNVAKAN